MYVQVTNKHGSTKDPPVTVEASVASNLGTILPERLRQLAQIITGSPPTENLGLDHSVFGKVKEISLSSFLNHSLHAPTPTLTPTPSPSPSPEQIYDTGPSMVPSHPPAFSPNSHHCPNCYTPGPSGASQTSAPSPQNAPYHSLSPISDSPAPSVAQGSQRCGSTDSPSPSRTSHPDQMSPNLSPHSSSESPLAVSTPQISPARSPSAGVANGPQGPDERSGKGLVSPLHVSSSFAYADSCKLVPQKISIAFQPRCSKVDIDDFVGNSLCCSLILCL